jgi:PAS domain S-box-containing protein
LKVNNKPVKVEAIFSLNGSEQQSRTVLNSLNDAIQIIDRQLRIVFQNSAMVKWLKKLDVDPNIIGKNLFEAFPFLIYEKLSKEYENVFETEESLVTNNKIELINRNVFTEALKIPIRKDGEINQILTIIRDITEQKEAEEKLKVSEEKYRNIVDNLIDMIIILDLKGNFQYISPQVYDISGFKPEEVIGKNGFKFMHPDDTKKTTEKLREALIKKESIYIEYRTIHKDGHYIEVAASGRIVNIEGEDRIFAVVRDLSNQKKTDRKLRESEEKYRLITENANDMIAIINDNIEYEYVNEAAFRNLMGRTREDLLGGSALQWVHPEDVNNCVNAFKDGWEEGEGSVQARFKDDNEKYHWLEVKGKRFTDQNGEEKSLIISRDISERIDYEQRLKDSEEKFRTLFEIAPASISVLDINGNIILSNQKFCNIHAVKNPELLEGRKILEFIAEKDWPKLKGMMKKSLQGLTRGLSQYTMLKDDGTEFLAEAISSGIKNKNGEIIGLIGVAQDITERNKSEQKLRESEEKYRSIFNNMNAGFAYHKVIVDDTNKPIDYKYIEANPAFEKLTGLKAEEIIGKKVTEILPGTENDPADWIGKFGKVGITGIPLTVEDYSEAIDRWYKVSGYSPKKGFFAVTFTDITERKKAEQKIKESEENFRTIAEHAFMGILILQDDKVEYTNNALLRIFEYSLEEVENWSKDDLLQTIHPDDLEYLREYRQKLRSKDPAIKPYYSYRVTTKSGKLKWIDQFSRSIIYKENPAELVTIMDITEKKVAEEELMKLNSLKSELLRRTSHELKTPLVSIKGFSDLLLTIHREKLDDYVLATIHEIKLGCERLENLIQDILKTSELESGAIQLKKSEGDLAFLIKLSIRESQGLAKLRNHIINLRIHDKLKANMEQEQIHQVISNLINNAIKYTPPEGTIDIKSDITKDKIIISIKDSGIGITTKEKQDIFKQFGKVERYGQGLDIISEGSGLGLFISKKIIELHGGEIWVESEGRNKGSIFYFSLPIINGD